MQRFGIMLIVFVDSTVLSSLDNCHTSSQRQESLKYLLHNAASLIIMTF